MSRLDDIKEAYDNIQVPAELKERVLQSMERGKKDACGEKKESGKAFAGKVNGIKRKVTCFRLSAWQKQWRQQLQCWSSVSMSVQQWLMQWNRCRYLVRLLKS